MYIIILVQCCWTAPTACSWPPPSPPPPSSTAGRPIWLVAGLLLLPLGPPVPPDGPYVFCMGSCCQCRRQMPPSTQLGATRVSSSTPPLEPPHRRALDGSPQRIRSHIMHNI